MPTPKSSPKKVKPAAPAAKKAAPAAAKAKTAPAKQAAAKAVTTKTPAKTATPVAPKVAAEMPAKTAKAKIAARIAKKIAAKPTEKLAAAPKIIALPVEAELPAGYLPGAVEDSISQLWEAAEIGKAEGSDPKKAWAMMLPPPNVTGVLHLGHAATVTVEDILARYHRMAGRDVLWLPGTDHAGIATQNVVERNLKQQGVTREELGREEFVQKVWEWKDEYHARITCQVKKMGASCDWSRERFTLDDDYAGAVNHAFVELHKKGLIYRDKKLVNWCPRCATVLSDIEVDHRDEEGHLYFIRYFVNSTDHSICVATTRPETLLGDMAVAVHPDDPRYKDFVGKKLILPIMNRLIPVIADPRIDPKFGTGAVKITPAHDPLDAAIAADHKLESIVVIGPQGRMTKHAGRFRGMLLSDARVNVVRYLDDIGNLEKIVQHHHAVSHCSRCDTVVEPMESLQWFVKMQPLAEKALQAVKKGELNFVPERFQKEFERWMSELRDWCISRQLWWGHQIPVWYCKKVAKWDNPRKKAAEGCQQMIVAEVAPEKCPHCGNLNLERDPDVLDTWFSSGLWPFATLGWPKRTKDFATFFPNAVLETGRDILFFWVARMVTMSLALTGKVPFKDVYLHGLVTDEQGRKMSKSRGNGVDPLEMSAEYGTDALRLTLVLGSTPGTDLRFSETKITGNRNFVNKIWNGARFVLGRLGKKREIAANPVAKSLADRWILSRLNATIVAATDGLTKYAFGEVAARLKEFFWNDFCDWYLELSKENPNPAVLSHVLGQSLRLLHPFAPFVTEKIWGQFYPPIVGGKKRPQLLAFESWPKAVKAKIDHEVDAALDVIQTIIGALRSVRNEMGVPAAKKIAVIIHAGDRAELITKNAAEVKKLAQLAALTVKKSGTKPDNAVAKIEAGLEFFLPLDKLLDAKEEQKRLTADLAEAKKYRELVAAKLANKKFVDRAPKNVVDAEKAKLAELENKIGKIEQRLKTLKK